MIPFYVQSYMSMTRARSTLEQVIKRRLKSFDLSLTQFHMLDLLVTQKASLPIQFRAPLCISSAGVTVVADQLERKQLLERLCNPPDRRTIRLHVTSKGAELHAAASTVLCDHDESDIPPPSFFLTLNSLLNDF